MYQRIVRPILFLFDPEKVHHFTFFSVRFIHKIPFASAVIRKLFQVNNKKLERTLFGITFKNPVGLAAGFDKNATLYNELANFGFGFVEIGTVTPKEQAGNPKKRLFRLEGDQAIINRMGFNNGGIEAIATNLKKNKKKIIIGGNLGKNTTTKPENYTQDYCEVFLGLYPYVDYFVLNISCPNVGSHAKLNDKAYLKELIIAVQKLNDTKESKKPILLKIAPDLNAGQLDEIIELVMDTKVDGVIASNTTTARDGLKTSKKRIRDIGNGGMSGQPIKEQSTKVIKYLSDNSNKAFPIIGVGGIHSAQDALEKINAGADLIQIYTGFIYKGPYLIKQINKAILKNENSRSN